LPSKVIGLNIFDILTSYRFMRLGTLVAELEYKAEGNMTFDELIEKEEEYIVDPCEAWNCSNKIAAWVEGEDCSLDLLQWYLALIIRSVDLENKDREMG
jgi:hypothetical protein